MENKDHFSNMRFLGVLRKRRQLEKISKKANEDEDSLENTSAMYDIITSMLLRSITYVKYINYILATYNYICHIHYYMCRIYMYISVYVRICVHIYICMYVYDVYMERRKERIS